VADCLRRSAHPCDHAVVRTTSTEDRWIVWLVTVLGLVVVGLFVGLLGVGSLALVLFWGVLFGLLVVGPALLTWHVRDSAQGRPGGEGLVALLRYVWPAGIAVWLVSRARRLSARRRLSILTALLVFLAVLVAVAISDSHVLRTGVGVATVLGGGILSGAVVGAAIAGLVDVWRWLWQSRGASPRGETRR
jgi:hypothetical protein